MQALNVVGRVSVLIFVKNGKQFLLGVFKLLPPVLVFTPINSERSESSMVDW